MKRPRYQRRLARVRNHVVEAAARRRRQAQRLSAIADPSRYVTFRSPARSERTAAILGIALGVSFFVCFATGLISHVMQHPPSWYAWPSRPAGFYRFTQGLHVATGIASIPLLLAKLWVVFPKLLEWPPVVGFAHFLERISLLPLLGGGMFMLITGVANIDQWYFFPFLFTSAHYAMAWVTIGALIVHIGAKATVVRTSLAREAAPTRHEPVTGGVSRRDILVGAFATAGLATLFSVGQSFSPLGKLALLAPRRPGIGPQGLPINRSAVSAGVIDGARSPDYRLRVSGKVSRVIELSLDELRSLPQHNATLPIACVEGWSQSAHWSGVPVRALLQMAGVGQGASVRVQSIERNGGYAQSELNRHHAWDPDTLLALDLHGEPLSIDHGYPCRLIGPNRPGVLQTKWVEELVVL